jgi:putative transposase
MELVTPKKKFGAKQIVTLIRQIEVSMALGKSAPEACRDAGISQQNYAMSC